MTQSSQLMMRLCIELSRASLGSLLADTMTQRCRNVSLSAPCNSSGGREQRLRSHHIGARIANVDGNCLVVGDDHDRSLHRYCGNLGSNDVVSADTCL